MKKNTHPTVFKTKVSCTCWAKFEMESVLKEIKVENCSKCHSFYTWETKVSTSAWRVAKFRARQEAVAKKDA